MTFYFMMCSWLNGEEPNEYTFHIFELLYVKNQMYWYEPHIVDCLNY